MPSAATPPAKPVSPTEAIGLFTQWCRRQPLAALALIGSLASLYYFYKYPLFFTGGLQSMATWAMAAWNPENNQEHSFAILPIAVWLVWHHRAELAAAPKSSSKVGLIYLLAGIAWFVLGVRCLQPRFPLFALPLVIYGAVRYVWGKEVGRVFIFPCLFLLFMVPIGGLVQGTVTLQLLVSSAVKVLSALIGVKIEVIGTTLRALDGSFNFEIAEGCSGIRSLMAMTTLAALYVHFTQKSVWKQLIIFAGSIVFALIGNIGRIFTVVLFARYISPRIAGGLYHDYSGFLFFPIAVMAMLGFSALVNLDWEKWFARLSQKDAPPLEAAGESVDEKSPLPQPVEKKAASPISYDY